jgi:imidazole glycerol-phosphate synthase subunit HisF
MGFIITSPLAEFRSVNIMLTRRIIPCLDVRDGRVVKGVRFSGLRDAGCPEELAAAYEEQGADELVLLDVSATPEGRTTHLETVRRVRAQLSIPLTTGGGVSSVENARALLEAGADKVSVNTAAVMRPQLINEISGGFGSQCTILAIDAAARMVFNQDDTAQSRWEVVVRSGTLRTGNDAIEWARQGVALGAGEILLTSWDRDGTRSGYDLKLLRAMADAVNVPIIASGGADSPDHMIEALRAGADAVLAASIFHEGNYAVGELKAVLARNGIEVRQ